MFPNILNVALLKFKKNSVYSDVLLCHLTYLNQEEKNRTLESYKNNVFEHFECCFVKFYI